MRVVHKHLSASMIAVFFYQYHRPPPQRHTRSGHALATKWYLVVRFGQQKYILQILSPSYCTANVYWSVKPHVWHANPATRSCGRRHPLTHGDTLALVPGFPLLSPDGFNIVDSILFIVLFLLSTFFLTLFLVTPPPASSWLSLSDSTP